MKELLKNGYSFRRFLLLVLVLLAYEVTRLVYGVSDPLLADVIKMGTAFYFGQQSTKPASPA